MILPYILCINSSHFSLQLEDKNPDASGITDHHLDKFKPTIEWQNIQIADFSELHMYVIRMAAQKKELLPSILQDMYNGFMHDGGILWENVFNSTEPTLSHVVGLTQCHVESGLVTILSLLQKVKPGESIDRRTGIVMICQYCKLFLNIFHDNIFKPMLPNKISKCKENYSISFIYRNAL